MKSFSGKVAAITGAASGIGRATAIELAREGCHLAIADLNEQGLEETAKIAEQAGIKVTRHVLDVSDKEAVHRFADDVVALHGRANIIMNNAGVALGETVQNMKYENIEWLMNINFWGVVYGTKAFLPYLQQAEEGHIINISSVFGLIGVPTQSAYNAAKFAVRGFTESLREELEIDGGNVSASCVHPGGIKTNIARNARHGNTGNLGPGNKEKAADIFDKLARTSSEKAARTILDGVRKNRRRILIGADAVVIDRMQRLLPTSYQKILEMGAKRGA